MRTVNIWSIIPTEFQQKYKVYQSNRRARWQELDSPTSFAIKCNNDILDYSIPPFAGILREVYDLEDYKQSQAYQRQRLRITLCS